jgi:hypothetical protein
MRVAKQELVPKGLSHSMCQQTSGFVKCPILGILNIAFKYLLEMKNPQYLDDVQLGHLPTNEKW